MKRIRNYFIEHDRGWTLSLFAAVCLVYLPFLGSPFFFDDRHLIRSDVLDRYRTFHLDLRWFAYTTFDWTARSFSDAAPHFFRLGNLLLHAANVILLFYLLRRIVAAVQPATRESSALKWGAWFAAMVFALHPVAVYAVGYVAQRSILMATLFVLLMQMSYLRALTTGRERWLVLAVLCYFLAVFSKEHSVLAPALLAGLSILLRERNAASARALWLTWGGFLIVAALVTLRAHGVLRGAYEPMAEDLFGQMQLSESTAVLHLLSAMTQVGLFFKYLLLWLIPNVSWMSLDMREQFILRLGDWLGWAGALAYVSYGAVAIRLLLRGGTRGLVGFALFYPWLQFGVELAGIRVQEPFVLYRTYLWMPGLLLLVPLLVLRFPQRRTLLLLGCVAVLLVPLAWNRLWVFADPLRMWNDVVVLLKDERTAGADRIFFNRGQTLMQMEKWEEAVVDLERSAALSPHLELVRYSLGLAYLNSGRYREAVEQFDAAIDIQADLERDYFGKGLALKRLQRNEEARQQFVRSCELGNFAACLLGSSRN